MSDGNKHDNGVHEVGTPETLQAYQEDTPGQEVEKYLAGIQEVIQEKKEKQKKSFMQVFQNPLKGFPYNEELDDNFVKPIKEGYGKIKDNHYDVKISVKKNDVNNVVKGINKLTGGNQYEYEDIDMDGVYPYGKTDGDIFIQGDDAGSLGLAIQKMFRNKVQVMGESLEERYNKKADIYDDDYRSQVKYNLRQKMMRLKKEKGPNWNNDLKDAQKHHDAIVKLDKQIEKDRKKYQAVLMPYDSHLSMGEETILEAKNLMPAIQKIVDTKGAAKVGGVMLDMFTASVITQAYDKVNDANKKRMESSNIQTLVKLAQRLMGMKEETVSEGKKIQDIVRKHKRELQKVQRSNNLELSKKAEDELSNWASSNGEIRGDDEDEFIDWLDNNLDDLIKGKIKEEKVNERTSLYEVNGMVGRKIRLKYRPQKPNSNKYDGKKLSSHSTIDKSDLYLDLVKNSWDIADDCNSIAIRVPNPTASEKDKEKWLDLVKSASIPTSLIRGGGLAPSEVKELQRDMTKAAKAFGGKVLSQAHEVSVNNYGGKLNLDKGFNAMLQAIDEFGMRNHVSVSYRDGVLTRIQDAGMYEEVQQEVESLQEERMSISTNLFKSFKKDIEKLMKKHDAYVSDTGLRLTFISSPKPMKGGFQKDLLKLLGMTEQQIQENKMSGSKLTGQEISVYFRRNKVRDKQTRKAVEIALDHGGAMNYAIKQIEKLKRGLSKNKDVQKALNYANYGEQVRIKDVGFMFKEDSPVAGNIQVEGDPYIPQKKGVNKNIAKYWKKEIKGISQKELEAVQSMYMITDHPGVVSMYKAGKRAFIKSLKD